MRRATESPPLMKSSLVAGVGKGKSDRKRSREVTGHWAPDRECLMTIITHPRCRFVIFRYPYSCCDALERHIAVRMMPIVPAQLFQFGDTHSDGFFAPGQEAKVCFIKKLQKVLNMIIADKVRKGVSCIPPRGDQQYKSTEIITSTCTIKISEMLSKEHTRYLIAPQIVNHAEIYGLGRFHPSAQHEPPNAARRRTMVISALSQASRRSSERYGTVLEALGHVLSCALGLLFSPRHSWRDRPYRRA